MSKILTTPVIREALSQCFWWDSVVVVLCTVTIFVLVIVVVFVMGFLKQIWKCSLNSPSYFTFSIIKSTGIS